MTFRRARARLCALHLFGGELAAGQRRAWPVFVRLAAVAVGAASVMLAVPVSGQAPDRTKPPQVGPPPVLKLPAIQTHRLSNGLAVWIVELHKVPVAQVTLVVSAAGASADPAGRFGLASLTAAMLDEGAGTRSALEIADAVDFLGASLVTSCTYDFASVALGVPVARLGEALEVVADVALRPTFPAGEIERLRKDRLTAFLQERDDPRAIASFVFPRVLYGTAHRYGTATAGTAEAVRSMTVEDLKAFYAALYRPDRAVLIVVGDVTPEGVLPLLERSFGSWRAAVSPAPPPPLPPVAAPTARQVYLVDKPGAPQSQIRIGTVGVARSTPDYFALQVLNTILGGSFTSRLNQNLREQHGYTYGASSSFAMRLAPGPFVAGAGVQGDKTAESLVEFFRELDGIVKPIPPDEAARARNYVALGFPAGFETTGDIASKLAELFVYGLPSDYFSTYVQRIEAVTPADLAAAARKYIQPEKLVVVVVGDRKTIEAPIRALKLGPIRVMTVEEAMGPPVAVPSTK